MRNQDQFRENTKSKIISLQSRRLQITNHHPKIIWVSYREPFYIDKPRQNTLRWRFVKFFGGSYYEKETRTTFFEKGALPLWIFFQFRIRFPKWFKMKKWATQKILVQLKYFLITGEWIS